VLHFLQKKEKIYKANVTRYVVSS